MQKWLLIFLMMSVSVFAQRKPLRGVGGTDLQKVESRGIQPGNNAIRTDSVKGIRTQLQDSIPPIESYLIKDYQDYLTTFDTTLTIQKHYAVNYLRRDRSEEHTSELQSR